MEARLKRIGRTAALGTGMTLAGMGIFAALRPAISDAKEFQTQVARFQTFGLSDALNADAVRFVKTTKVIGASYTDLMRNMVEAQGVFRESGLKGPEALAGAKLAVPVLARIHFANSALNPEEQGRRDASGLQMIRFIEMRGGLGDARKFNEIADAGFKAIQSSGGNVNWEQFRQFMATGGVSAQGLSNTALFGQMEPIIGELKGGRAGTALMTAYNRIEGLTRVPNQVAQALAGKGNADIAKQVDGATAKALVSSGIWDASKITWNALGGIKSVKGNPLRDSALFASSPIDFYQRDLLPMYQRMQLDQAGINRENTLIFGRTGGAMFSLIDRALRNGTIQGSVASQAKALGINASVNVASRTVAGQEEALRASFKNNLIAVGMAALPVLSRLLTTVTPMLQAMSDWTVKHPRMFNALVNGLIALGVVLVAGGMITNLVATAQALKLLFDIAKSANLLTRVVAFLPRLFTGLRMVGTVVATLATAIDWPVVLIAAAAAAVGLALFQIWKHWDASKGVWENVKNEFSMFVSFLTGLPGKLWNAMPPWARAIIGGGARVAAAIIPGGAALQAASMLPPADRRRSTEHGKALGNGIIRGLVATHPFVAGAAVLTGDVATRAFKGAMGIHSPSRVFASLGVSLIDGLILGLQQRAPALTSTLRAIGLNAAAAPSRQIRFGDMAPVAPTRSPYVQTRGTHVTVHTKTMLDGRVLTETVTRHQAHDASRPHAGTSTFDPTMSAAPVGLGYHP